MNVNICPEGGLPVVADLDGTLADLFQGQIFRRHMREVVKGIQESPEATYCGVATERPDFAGPYSRWQVFGSLPDASEQSVSHYGIGDLKAVALLNEAVDRAKDKDPDRITADLAIIDNWPHRLGGKLLGLALDMGLTNGQAINISVGVPPALRGNIIRDRRFAKARENMFDITRANGGTVRGFENSMFGARNGGVTAGGLTIMISRIGRSTLNCEYADGASFVKDSLAMVHLVKSMPVNNGSVRQRRRSDNSILREPFDGRSS